MDREINCKLVYWGPENSGKKTNIHMIHQNTPARNCGVPTQVIAAGVSCLHLSLFLGKIGGIDVNLKLFALPVITNKSVFRLLLRETDGIIFVADSRQEKLQENIVALEMLDGNLRDCGISLADISFVIQWNKRASKTSVPSHRFQEMIQFVNFPFVEGNTYLGKGVFPALKMCMLSILKRKEENFSFPGFNVPNGFKILPDLNSTVSLTRNPETLQLSPMQTINAFTLRSSSINEKITQKRKGLKSLDESVSICKRATKSLKKVVSNKTLSLVPNEPLEQKQQSISAKATRPLQSDLLEQKQQSISAKATRPLQSDLLEQKQQSISAKATRPLQRFERKSVLKPTKQVSKINSSEVIANQNAISAKATQQIQSPTQKLKRLNPPSKSSQDRRIIKITEMEYQKWQRICKKLISQDWAQNIQFKNLLDFSMQIAPYQNHVQQICTEEAVDLDLFWNVQNSLVQAHQCSVKEGIISLEIEQIEEEIRVLLERLDKKRHGLQKQLEEIQQQKLQNNTLENNLRLLDRIK